MSRCSIPLASFSPCLASFTHCACGSIRHSARGLASRRSLRLRLHSLRSARGRFRDITFFISPFRYRERYERKRSDWSRRRKEQSDASLGTERSNGAEASRRRNWRSDVQLVMVITLFFSFSAAAAAASCFSFSTCARIFCCSGVKEQPIFSI